MRALYRLAVRYAGGWLVALIALPAAHAATVFERWQPAASPTPSERALLSCVRQRAVRRGVHLHTDGRLAQAAHHLLPWAHKHAGDALPMPLLQACAWQQGVTDGELSAVAVRTTAPQLRAAVAHQIDALLSDDSDIDHLGVALCEEGDGGDVTAVAVLSRRLLRLAPLPSHVAPHATLPLSGSRRDARIDAVWLAIARPGAAIAQQAVPLTDGHFATRLPMGAALGTVQVQLLVERGRGPEVAVHFPLAVGASAPASLARVECSRHQSLLTLIYGLRQAHQLPLPTPSPALMQLAQAHADDMAAHHFFAHVSPTYGDAAERLEAAGQRYVRVVENLASAADTDEAFAQWQQSPSHMANLLDGRVDHIGIGIVVPKERHQSILIVLLMARL